MQLCIAIFYLFSPMAVTTRNHDSTSDFFYTSDLTSVSV